MYTYIAIEKKTWDEIMFDGFLKTLEPVVKTWSEDQSRRIHYMIVVVWREKEEGGEESI